MDWHDIQAEKKIEEQAKQREFVPASPARPKIVEPEKNGQEKPKKK